MESAMIWIHAVSPTHIGAADSVGVIDLPVVREKVTGWPYLPASAIKGVLRDAAGGSGADSKLICDAFGPDRISAEQDGAGALWFSDAQLLCLPVRSFYGTLAWATCPFALMRLGRDITMAGVEPLPELSSAPADTEILTCHPCAVTENDSVYLEELDLHAKPTDEARALAEYISRILFEDDWASEFRGRFGIVSDNVFAFLAETATDVSARVRLSDETKTVNGGALWYEESVPAETIFTMPLISAPRKGQRNAVELVDLATELLRKPQQIGGKATIGRGIVRACVQRTGAIK